MARTIQEIKSEMAGEFMRNESAAALYGFEPGAAFADRFGAASIENILFYVWAVCAWAVEQLIDRHKAEVTAELDEQVAHRPKWYRDRVLAFMANMELMPDSDRYDTTGMTESDMAARRVVKHAVAVENRNSSALTIKVAGESGGRRQPLDQATVKQLQAYISEIKDAGVRIELVNQRADSFFCSVDIYYNAMLDPNEVKAACEAAVRDYVENLPFNGEYSNMALVDRLQLVDGVKIVELRSSSSKSDNDSRRSVIEARRTPAAGYFNPKEINIELIEYDDRD